MAIKKEKDLTGLGGWLILVGVGIVLSPFRIMYQVFPTYSQIFSSGHWALMTTPGTESYHVLWAPILVGEIAINLGLILAWIFIAFLFFSKKSMFPKWFIAMQLFTLLFIVLDALAIKLVLPDEPAFDPATIKEIGRSLFASLIWIPYMLISKRVKLTFTEQMGAS